MKEVEAGRIRMTAPINLYLPEKLQVKDQGFKRQILVRDLATHTPGFEDRVLGQFFEQNPKRIRPLADYLREERPHRVREAGALPTYSNYGAALAGEAVSWVNGHPYQDIVESEIIRPLGLAHTTFREPYPARADLPPPMPAGTLADQVTVSTGYRWSWRQLRAADLRIRNSIAPGRRRRRRPAADMALHADDPERRPAKRSDHLQCLDRGGISNHAAGVGAGRERLGRRFHGVRPARRLPRPGARRGHPLVPLDAGHGSGS